MDKAILRNDFLQIEYLTNSLRIVSLIPSGKSNMLADISHLAPIPTPYGDYEFVGGHRLWHAPEAMPRTYIPDAGELTITDLPDGISIEAQTEPGTGIRKRIEIRLAPDKPSIMLTHTLVNDGLWTVELAPWTITQFRLGGTVLLPVPVGNSDPAGLLHNRQFSFWPYARLNDPRLKLDDDFIVFKANALLPPFKLGYFNTHGWVAYWLDEVFFRKTFTVQAGLPHPDNNCNAEIYCNDQFVELESLAPLAKLSPGAAVTHVETWEVISGMSLLHQDIQQKLIGT